MGMKPKTKASGIAWNHYYFRDNLLKVSSSCCRILYYYINDAPTA
jgi:hypothetical protein